MTDVLNPETQKAEIQEAADSGLFITQRVTDLAEQQDLIANLSTVMKLDVSSSLQQARLGDLNRMLEALTGDIKNHEGFLIAVLPDARYGVAKTIQDYGFESEDGVVLVLPTAVIKVCSPNPRFYGNGHDVSPVLNLQIEASDNDRRWIQIPLEQAKLALYSETTQSSPYQR